MSKRETYVVERMDRRREQTASKDARTARSLYLRMNARRTIDTVLADLNSPKEQAVILQDLIDVAAEKLEPLIGKVEAATVCAKISRDLCADLKFQRAVAQSEAERLFKKQPANDVGGEE